MIDIAQALYNVLHSRFGRDVRTSIHDAIYQINENANEAVQTAKAMGVGTAVSSSTSSSEGYVAGNLYLNSQTWDLWQCVGVNSWVNKGNIKGTKGDKGVDGTNNYIHIRYSQFYDGTDFTASPTASSQFMGVYYGNSATAPTNKQDYQWTSYVGASGTSAYLHIRYSDSADGSNFVSEPTALTKYVGFYAGTSSSAPANKSYYTWSKYVGDDGDGAGDMLKSEYAGKGIVGTVDKADEARIAATAGSATTAAGLKKTNGETVTADEVSAKITDIDNKITKPTSATKDQVLTYNGSEWVADDSKGGGGGSATEVTYNNATSGLTSTNVQGAIDEVSKSTQYSSDEIEIGTYGSYKVYRKVVEGSILGATTTVTSVTHNFKILRLDVILYTSQFMWANPYYNTATDNYRAFLDGANRIEIASGSSYPGQTNETKFRLIAEYYR